MKQPTTLRTHLLSMLSAGIAYEQKQAHETSSVTEHKHHKQRSAHLRAALYRVSVHKFPTQTQ